jgi:hypothetical protein
MISSEARADEMNKKRSDNVLSGLIPHILRDKAKNI